MLGNPIKWLDLGCALFAITGSSVLPEWGTRERGVDPREKEHEREQKHLFFSRFSRFRKNLKTRPLDRSGESIVLKIRINLTDIHFRSDTFLEDPEKNAVLLGVEHVA